MTVSAYYLRIKQSNIASCEVSGDALILYKALLLSVCTHFYAKKSPLRKRASNKLKECFNKSREHVWSKQQNLSHKVSLLSDLY